jgi:hypothetical protein
MGCIAGIKAGSRPSDSSSDGPRCAGARLKLRVQRNGRWVLREELGTYVRMPADGLDGLLVKVTRVAKNAAGDVVCVLEALKDGGSDRELGTLSQLHAFAL